MRIQRAFGGTTSPTSVFYGFVDVVTCGFAAALVRLGRGTHREVASFPGSRASTRAELYRRLHRARDYVESCFAQPLSVAAIARIACLSPYHFQRMFRQAFGHTPMQFLQARRLKAARRLLATTDRPITSICFDVGFDSLGSFSWLFRREFGLPPRNFRRQQSQTGFAQKL